MNNNKKVNMKKYNCPYCKAELSTNWDDLIAKNNIVYLNDFLTCLDCKKEFKLFVIENKYLQVIGMTKHEYAQERYFQKTLANQFNLEIKNNPDYPHPEKYRTYLKCISNASLNKEFDLDQVVEIAESTPAEALMEVYFKTATRIFQKHKDLKKIDLLCYVMAANNLPLLCIQTIRNKPGTKRTTHGGFTMFDQSYTSPISYDEEINIDIARQEAPFFFPEFGNLGFQAINF